MSLEQIDTQIKFFEQIVKRKTIIKTLYPDIQIQQSELAQKTGISKGNLSKYLNDLEANGVIIISTDTNSRGQPVNIIELTKKTLELITLSAKVVSSGKPTLNDFDSFNIFLNRLSDPDLGEASKNSIQMMSNQYFIPIESGFFEFIRDNILRDDFEKARRVLIMSTCNIVRDMNEPDKKEVSKILEPVLSELLQFSSSGLKRETNHLFKELGLYDLSYDSLETRYISTIIQNNVSSFLRTLILQNHKDQIPKLRANLMILHAKSDQTVRSIILNELPLIR